MPILTSLTQEVECEADGGFIKAGNFTPRTLSIEAAHRLARYQPKWQEMNDSLKAKEN